MEQYRRVEPRPSEEKLPDLQHEILSATIDALDAHRSMSTQAPSSETGMRAIKEILLKHEGLSEPLPAQAAPPAG